MMTLKDIIEDEIRWASNCSTKIPQDSVLASLRRIREAHGREKKR